MVYQKNSPATSIFLFTCFIIFSILVATRMFVGFDQAITQILQSTLPRFVDLPFSYFSLIGSAEVSTFLWLSLVVIFAIKNFWRVILLMPLFFISVAVEIVGKIMIYHPAPPLSLYRGVLELDLPSHIVRVANAYPSGHMTRVTFLLVTALLLLQFLPKQSRKIIKGSLFIFLILMAISRVYLAEHWTTDVIGGLLLGSSFALLTTSLSKKGS